MTKKLKVREAEKNRKVLGNLTEEQRLEMMRRIANAAPALRELAQLDATELAQFFGRSNTWNLQATLASIHRALSDAELVVDAAHNRFLKEA